MPRGGGGGVIWIRTLEGGHIRAKILKLSSGGLQANRAEQSRATVQLGYQLSICSGTKENHGKP
jgi:hypothetical protein